MVTFTGSTPTGRAIMAAASETLKKVFLELGGKSAAIVLDDADFDTAALFSAFSIGHPRGPGLRAHLAAAGAAQAPRRDRRADQEQLRPGAATATRPIPSTYMGPLISEKQRDKVDGMVKRAVEAGATLVTGGEKVDPGYFYTPTLLDQRRSRTARSPRRRCSARCSPSSPTTTTTTRCGSPTTPSTDCPARVFGSEDRALAVARRIRTGTFSINGGNVLQPRQPVRRLQAVRHRPRDGRGRPRGVPGDARRSRRWSECVMSRPLDGIRVLEVAMYGFVPSAGAVLARVGRRRHQGRARGHRRPAARAAPDRAAAGRGRPESRTSSTPTAASAASAWTCRCPRAARCCSNWRKRADVFLTSFLPGHRQKFGIDVDDIRAVNPKIIYARGSALGPRGEESVKGGYDMTAFWCRAGTARHHHPAGHAGHDRPAGTGLRRHHLRHQPRRRHRRRAAQAGAHRRTVGRRRLAARQRPVVDGPHRRADQAPRTSAWRRSRPACTARRSTRWSGCTRPPTTATSPS